MHIVRPIVSPLQSPRVLDNAVMLPPWNHANRAAAVISRFASRASCGFWCASTQGRRLRL